MMPSLPYVILVAFLPYSCAETLQPLSGKLQYDRPFYHTGDQIRSEARRLAGACGGKARVASSVDGGIEMEVLYVKDAAASPINRMFVASGEHAREIIGPEAALNFLKGLCGEVPLGGAHSADELLKNTEFAFVLNANPAGRKLVDEGQYCQRASPSNVDLNRNWETPGWTGGNGAGGKPFSEPETRLLSDFMTKFKPTSYLSVHSGNYGLYMPWAYSPNFLATGNQKRMLKVLAKLDDEYCQCPFGAAGKEVGYPAPGTSIDWAYSKLKTPYSFAFELYLEGSKDAFRERWVKAKQQYLSQLSLLQIGEGAPRGAVPLTHPSFKEFFRQHPSEFVQVNASSGASMNRDWCLNYYNPTDEATYTDVVTGWTQVFADMSSTIAADIAARQR